MSLSSLTKELYNQFSRQAFISEKKYFSLTNTRFLTLIFAFLKWLSVWAISTFL